MSSYFEKLKCLQDKAYAPYSNFRVASILVMLDGEEFPGVNVENASFGGTICAERTSFVGAITAHGGDGGFKEIHLLAGENFAMPCGFCRQVMNEFVNEDFRIIVYNNTGETQICTMASLLPNSFSRNDLI